MEIRRDFCLDKLIKRKHNGLIKIISGIRRCGKSYLLNTIFYHHLLESGVEKDHIKMYYLLLDEVQMLIGETTSATRKNWRIC